MAGVPLQRPPGPTQALPSWSHSQPDCTTWTDWDWKGRSQPLHGLALAISQSSSLALCCFTPQMTTVLSLEQAETKSFIGVCHMGLSLD